MRSTAFCPGASSLPWRRVMAFVLTCMALCASSARALTPESPEVKAVIEKAMRFLEQPLPPALVSTPNNSAPGAKALVAMCLLKTGRKPDHPKVKEAVDAIRGAIPKDTSLNFVQLDVYNLGICIVFLFELDPAAYHYEMERLASELVRVQKPHGGWGYPGMQTGDTSMTQYGCLGLWTAESAGITVPVDTWERAANWLLRTQDPSGAWGYQGNDPGNFSLVKQPEIRNSLAAAGLGSLYICSDRLQLFPPQEAEEKSDLPSAFKRKVKPRVARGSGVVDANRVREAMNRGKGWHKSNYRVDPPEWAYYYLYAFERYQSFREMTAGEGKADESWYDDGYRFLAKSQTQEGFWDSPPGHNTVADTTFGILFLLRSTKKVIERAKTLGAGMLVGGRGLPKDGTDAVLGLGGVKAKKISGPAKELLKILGNPDDPKFAAVVDTIDQEGIEPGDETMTDVEKRLRDLLATGQSPQAKAAALKALARTRNLDDVPLLLEALKDPDPLVFSAANDGLRFISRKFYGAGFWGGSDEKSREQALKQWKEWYLSIRPDAVLKE